MSSPLLEVKDLQVTVGEEQKVLLNGLNLTINAGETHVLMGHNGAGKSTLMSALMGDPRYTITRGQIIFNGQDIAHLKPRQMQPVRRNMQMIFQDPYSSLDPRKTASYSIEEAMKVHHIGDTGYTVTDVHTEPYKKKGLFGH